MPTILGIDEAGRGAVIGPLVLAGALIEDKNIPKLEQLKVRDSKELSPRQREMLFNKIKTVLLTYEIIKLSPREIDNAVQSKHTNLNWLEADKSALIINKLEPDKAVLDCPSPNCRAYMNFIREKLKNKNLKIVAEHKADQKYKIVSAASILAKVVRDLEIEKIKQKYGDCGPGYPANEITQRFLKENKDKHLDIIRYSWATMKNAKRNEKQETLF
ncbi:ribonuclease HII [archaeon]|nr:ribonuclease HII [archaeon]